MEELDFKELISIFWSKKVAIIVITILVMCIGGVYSYFFITPMYTSSTTLVLVQANTPLTNDESAITQTDVTLNSNLVATYSELVKSKTIIRKVVKNLSQYKLDEDVIRKNISVTSVEDTEIIKISVKDENPQIAAAIANEIAEVFSDKVVEIYKISNVALVDPAEPDDKPSNINHIKNIVIFALMGVVISAGYILIVYLLDTTIKDEKDIENCTQLTVLASIPFCDSLPKKKGGRRV